GGKEAECSSLIDAARSDHRNVREHRLEVLNVTVTSDVPTRHDLDEIRTQFPRCDDSGWCEGAGDHNDVLLYRELYGLGIKAVTRKKFGPGIQATARRLDVVDTAGADNHVRCVLHDMRNDFDRFRHRQRDFQNRDAATGDGLGGESASSIVDTRMEGMIPSCSIRLRTSCLFNAPAPLGDRCKGRRVDYG